MVCSHLTLALKNMSIAVFINLLLKSWLLLLELSMLVDYHLSQQNERHQHVAFWLQQEGTRP